MAGRRHKDFRSGDLNEELGVLLIKGLAAVATVPRPEDVGIDAIATLLRDDENDLLIAENSFYIQFKSSSKKKIKYVDHEVRWLESLKLPFFIGRIRKEDSAIDLFATHGMSHVFLEMEFEEIYLHLDTPPKNRLKGNSRSIYIGPPLLTWSVKELSSEQFVYDAYSVLRQYLDAEQRNIEYRGIRYIETITWETGQIPKCEQSQKMIQTLDSDEEIRKVFHRMAPYLQAIASRALFSNDRKSMGLIVQLVNYMRDHEFDPDPHNTYQLLFNHLEDE